MSFCLLQLTHTVNSFWIYAVLLRALVISHTCSSFFRTSSILSKDHPPDKKPKSDKTSPPSNEFDPTGKLSILHPFSFMTYTILQFVTPCQFILSVSTSITYLAAPCVSVSHYSLLSNTQIVKHNRFGVNMLG